MPLDPSIILNAGRGLTPVQSPLEAQAQVLKLRDLQQQLTLNDQEQQVRQGQIDDRNLLIAKRQREQAGNEALATSVKKHSKLDPQSGDVQIDYQGVADDLASAGFHELAASWLKTQNENAEAIEKLASTRRAHAQQGLALIGDLAFRAGSQDDFTAGVALAAAHGLLTEDQARQVVGQVQGAGGTAWQAVANHYKQFSPAYQTQQAELAKPTTLAPGAKQVVNGQVVAENPQTLTPYQQQELKLRAAAEAETRRHNQVTEQQTNPLGDKRQEQLEQQYRGVLQRTLSSRSGGLGLEDQKVNQAKHLLAIFDQNHDPKTGEYAIPKMMVNELALGLARLTSPTGTVGLELERDLNQRSLKGDLAGIATYLTGQPVSGSTQAIFRMFKDSIAQQGQVAEQNRERYFDAIRAMAPTDLADERRQKVEQALNLNRLTPAAAVTAPTAPAGWKYVPKPGGGWTAVPDPTNKGS